MNGVPIDDGILDNKSKRIQFEAQMEIKEKKWTCSDPDSGHKVVENSPDRGYRLQFSCEQSIETKERNTNENDDVQPIQMFMPIGKSPWLVDDVQFIFATRE